MCLLKANKAKRASVCEGVMFSFPPSCVCVCLCSSVPRPVCPKAGLRARECLSPLPCHAAHALLPFPCSSLCPLPFPLSVSPFLHDPYRALPSSLPYLTHPPPLHPQIPYAIYTPFLQASRPLPPQTPSRRRGLQCLCLCPRWQWCVSEDVTAGLGAPDQLAEERVGPC